MKNHRSIIALCAALFAATLLALPGGAWAKGGEKTNDSHAKIEGRAENEAYYDSLRQAVNDAIDGETVTLIEDDENSYSNTVDVKKSIVVDLNGNTLSGSTADVLQVMASNVSVTVKNGTITSDKRRGVYVGGYQSTVKLENVSVFASSADYEAVDVLKGTLEVTDSTITNSATNALKIEGDGSVTVNSGTVNGDVLNSGSLSIKGGDFLGTVPTTGKLNITGGSFKDSSLRGSIGSGYLMQYMLPNEETGEVARYVVTSIANEESVRNSSGWYLNCAGKGGIYYEYGTEHSVAWADYQFYPGNSPKQVFRVTFKDGADEIYIGRFRTYGIGTLPTKEDTDEKVFLGWYNGDVKAEPTTSVTQDITYEAKWGDAIAEYNGTKYTSLQAAVTAATEAGSEATVKLLNNTTESVEIPAGAKLTIDLNGKTLTALSTGGNLNAISLKSARDLTIDNGTISSGSRCVYADYEVSTGSTVTLGSKLTCTSSGYDAVDVESKDGAVTPTKLIIQGGNYTNTSDGGSALRVDGPELSILGGTFTTKSDTTINLRDTAGASFSGDISGHIGIASYISKDKVSIQPGTTFGDDKNKDYIDSSKYHLLPNSQGKYEVSAHEKRLVVDEKPTATKDGSGHYVCDADGCDWEDATSVVIPAGTDVDAPVITGLAEGASYDINKTFTVTDASSFTVTVDGKEISKNLDGTFTLPFGENMTVVATDVVGITSSVANVSNYKDHEWGTAVDDKDGEHHTYTCAHTECETKTKQESHSGGKATCKTQAVCEECGASYGETDPNNHEGAASSGYSYDGTNHWKTYTCCTDVVYPNTTHAHELKTVVTKQPTDTETGLQHDECKDCGYKGPNVVIPATGEAPYINGLIAGASYDLADDKPTFTVVAANLKDVTVNGEVVTASDRGVYTLNVTGESVVVVATDENGKSTTVTVSCYENHEWGTWQGNGNGTHYRNCQHSGCNAHEGRPCNGGTATCVSKAVCEDCGLEYGDTDSSNHAGPLTSHYDDDEHWKTCDSCGDEVADSREEHDLVLKSDDAGHWYECTECDYKSDQETHSYGEWEATTEGHKRTCEDCGYVLKEKHSLVWVTDKEATATEDGSQHEECEVCGYKTGNTKVIPKTGGDSDDDDDKGDDSDKGGSKGNKKGDSKKLPATGDPAIAISGLAAIGAALAGLGAAKRRK